MFNTQYTLTSEPLLLCVLCMKLSASGDQQVASGGSTEKYSHPIYIDLCAFAPLRALCETIS